MKAGDRGKGMNQPGESMHSSGASVALASTYIMGSLMYTTKVNYVSHALSYVFAVFFFSDYM